MLGACQSRDNARFVINTISWIQSDQAICELERFVFSKSDTKICSTFDSPWFEPSNLCNWDTYKKMYIKNKGRAE